MKITVAFVTGLVFSVALMGWGVCSFYSGLDVADAAASSANGMPALAAIGGGAALFIAMFIGLASRLRR